MSTSVNPPATYTPEDTEIELSAHGFLLRVACLGASLRGLWKLADTDGEPIDIVTGYSGAAGKVGGQGDVLIPFPGRVAAGRYTFDGQQQQLHQNDKDGPNAIHGYLRTKTWHIAERSNTGITFASAMDASEFSGYPYALQATISYALTVNGLSVIYSILNSGNSVAPVAIGFHPYFRVGSGLIDTWTLELPMQDMLEMVNLIPTGKLVSVESTEFNFKVPRKIDQTRFNSCFLNPLRNGDGLWRINLSNTKPDGSGSRLSVWADQSLNFVVLYSGDPLPETHRRRSLAIEPMSCGADGFNHPSWGLVSLLPGETTSGNWGVDFS